MSIRSSTDSERLPRTDVQKLDETRTDIALLDRIVARDEQAVGELYDRHNRLLFGLVLRILRDRGVIRTFGALTWRPIVAASGMVGALAVVPFDLLPLALCLGIVVYGALLLLLGGVTRDEIGALAPFAALRSRRAAPAPVPAESFGYED